MADSKISTLTSSAGPAQQDYLLIIDVPNANGTGTFTSNKITLKSFFGAIPANTSIGGTLSITGNTTNTAGSNNFYRNLKTANLVFTTTSTPANSTVADSTIPIGMLWFDTSYLYIKVASNTIKRVALSAF